MKLQRAAALLVAAAVPVCAWAHSPIPGIKIFYSGLAHPFISPAHLIALLALGLVVGQRSAALDRLPPPLLTLFAAVLVGLAFTLARLFGEPDTDRALLVFAAVIGLAVAAAWAMPLSLLLGLVVAVALAVTLSSAPEGVSDADRRSSLFGSGVATLAIVAYVAVMVCVAERPWLRIAVRVFGSWIAAAALLVLALSFAPGRGA